MRVFQDELITRKISQVAFLLIQILQMRKITFGKVSICFMLQNDNKFFNIIDCALFIFNLCMKYSLLKNYGIFSLTFHLL